jgi:2-methoxy-6-polyprenyl-1,4-benzoquinol methylase
MFRIQQSHPARSSLVRLLSPIPVFRILTLSSLYESYSFSVIPLLGTILAGDRASYQYLVESIRKFPSQSEFAQMISNAGFEVGEMEDGGAWRDQWGGIAAIHTGVKLA